MPRICFFFAANSSSVRMPWVCSWASFWISAMSSSAGAAAGGASA